jgi:hypothetical protein
MTGAILHLSIVATIMALDVTAAACLFLMLLLVGVREEEKMAALTRNTFIASVALWAIVLIAWSVYETAVHLSAVVQ